MLVNFSFRPAWDARKKMDEVQPTRRPSPRPVSLPKFPNTHFTMPFSPPSPNTNPNFSSPVPPSATSKFSLSHLSFPTLHASSAPFVSTLHGSLSSPLSLDIDSCSLQSVQPPPLLDRTSTVPPNAYHRRFLSTLETLPLIQPMTPKLSSRAPQLDFPSHLRPPVSAADRLMAWTTPYAQQQRSTLEASLPPALLNKAYLTTHSALAPSTRSVYGAGLLRFTQFCDSWKINEQDRMPASAVLLTAFASQCTGSYSGKTINSWLAGLRSWPILNRAPWHGNDDWVRLARTTASKQGTAFKHPLWVPVSLEHLHILHCGLDLTNPFHAAVWATALTTFFDCRCLGETTVKSLASFDPAFHVTRNTSTSFHQLSH